MQATKKICQFDSFKAQIRNIGVPFEVNSTTYTKRVKIGKQVVMFADKPTTTDELKLINLARTDGKKFLQNNIIKQKKSEDIIFYKYIDSREFDKPIKGYKIDLSSAYWVCAFNQSIITEKTNNFFVNRNLTKGARLKALGSFATKNHKQSYNDKGVMIKESITYYNEDLRNLYMYVCDEVSRVMQTVAGAFASDTLYFYWDCLFFSEKVDVVKVQELIKSLGFGSTVESSEFAVLKGKYLSRLIDVNKKIEYPIKQADIC